LSRYTLLELIELKVLGFEKEKRVKRFQPFEPIQSVTYHIDSDRITINSETQSQQFFNSQFETIKRTFKTDNLFLSKSIEHEETDSYSHLLIIALGRGYYGLLTGIRQKRRTESDE